MKIDVSKLPRGAGKIILTLTWVDRMRAGLPFGGSNLICVCTKAWWKNKTGAQQNEVIIHEMDHKIGMVLGRTGTLPHITLTFMTPVKAMWAPTVIMAYLQAKLAMMQQQMLICLIV
jgi:Mlc titration factor MtfA (ptsG expression regulator)